MGWDGFRGEDKCRVVGSGGVGGHREGVGEARRRGMRKVNGGGCGRWWVVVVAFGLVKS